MSGGPITLLICALGGEGGGVLAEWLYDTAVHAGHAAQATSIPGVAQRTGATTYYVEIHPQAQAGLGGRRPVFSLSPVPGAIDLLVSSELLETVRQIGLGMATADRTEVITSSARALTVAEKMQPADGRQAEAVLLGAVQAQARSCRMLDMTALAQDSGTVISAALLGAIAASGRLPFERTAFEDSIRRGGRGVAASLRGFAAAFDAVAAGRAQQAQALALASRALGMLALPEALRTAFPPAVHEVLALGHARVLEYQDAAYAQLYVQRLQAVLAAERGTDPTGAQAWAVTRETARWLALWMAYDDLVRVAALKLQRSRIERVRREVKATPDEIVKVYDHFKPGIAEIAGLLPATLAQRLQAWDVRRIGRGREPWAWPLKLGSHTVLGTLALRIAAGLKGLRRRGQRHAQEQRLIEQWLDAVQQGTAAHWALGHELAQCGRLIKGYGATNERGKRNLLQLVDHLAAPAEGTTSASRAAAVRAASEAALADDAGSALDRALAAHGAPARPVPEQPIRWHRRRPASTGASAPP